MNTDPYDILGISRGASEDEIKKAYRALVMKYHPDLNPDDSAAAEKMSEINAAYERIRAVRSGDKQVSEAGSPFYKYMDPDDIIEAVFGSLGKFAESGFKGHIEPEYDLYEILEKYVERGSLRQAALVLDSIDTRDSRWYYYAARVCFGTGNLTDALRHADCAVNMAPGNQMYRLLRQNITDARDEIIRRRTLKLIIAAALCGAVLFVLVMRIAAAAP